MQPAPKPGTAAPTVRPVARVSCSLRTLTRRQARTGNACCDVNCSTRASSDSARPPATDRDAPSMTRHLISEFPQSSSESLTQPQTKLPPLNPCSTPSTSRRSAPRLSTPRTTLDGTQSSRENDLGTLPEIRDSHSCDLQQSLRANAYRDNRPTAD